MKMKIYLKLDLYTTNKNTISIFVFHAYNLLPIQPQYTTWMDGVTFQQTSLCTM